MEIHGSVTRTARKMARCSCRRFGLKTPRGAREDTNRAGTGEAYERSADFSPRAASCMYFALNPARASLD